MGIGARTTMVDNDRILEKLNIAHGIGHRSRVTHLHHRHRLHPRHPIDIHGGHTIADNPPPLAPGVELSTVPYVMSDGMRDSDPGQQRSTMGVPTQKNSFRSTPRYYMLLEQMTTR